MEIKYQAAIYRPDLVTGRYVRCESKHRFRIFETATNTDKSSRLWGNPGMGPTLREYDIDGSELPDALREICIATRQTQAWPLTAEDRPNDQA